LNAYTIN